jgi:hypothetical protein
MRLNIFQKAKYLLTTKQVKIINVSDYSTSFSVGKYHVVFKYKANKLIALCSCSAGAFMSPCSHVLAAMVYLTNGEKN